MARGGQSLAFEEDFLATDSAPDAAFDAFVLAVGRSPGKLPSQTPVPDCWGYGTPEAMFGPHGDFYPCTAPLEPQDQSWSACFDMRAEPIASAGMKRKFSTLDDNPGLLCEPLEIPPVLAQTRARDDSEVPTLPMLIPTSPKTQTDVTPVKRSNSSCTLKPFSVVKEFPGMDTMSLADVNRRIQLFAETDTTPSSSSSQSSGSFTQASTPRLRPRIKCEVMPGSRQRDGTGF